MQGACYLLGQTSRLHPCATFGNLGKARDAWKRGYELLVVLISFFGRLAACRAGCHGVMAWAAAQQTLMVQVLFIRPEDGIPPADGFFVSPRDYCEGTNAGGRIPARIRGFVSGKDTGGGMGFRGEPRWAFRFCWGCTMNVAGAGPKVLRSLIGMTVWSRAFP